ncbi:MAG: FHA domain-containing protein [Verrucomicrobia bacterium]|nr:FHA domain-containing protein [Verrucomicrobiota bacterium]
MAKFVVLKNGTPAESYELKTDRTTIGRSDTNSFPIPDGSVSGTHCEVILLNDEIHVKDLGSTNGTFLDGHRIRESRIDHGQILKLGEVEMRLELPGKPVPPTPTPASSDSRKPGKQGVRVDDLTSQGRQKVIDKTTFTQKSNKAEKSFIIFMIVLGAVVLAGLSYAAYSLLK